MNRRNFLAIGSRVGIATTVLGAVGEGKQLQQASAEWQPDFAEPQTKIMGASGLVVIGHPKHLRKVQLQSGVLYDGSVVKFQSDGYFSLPSGRKFFGKKGDKFNLICIRDAASKTVIKKKLFKGIGWDTLQAKLAATKNEGGK